MSRRHASLVPLSHQHQHALALAVIIRRRFGMKKDERAWGEEMAAKIRQLYSGELAGHFAVEEDVLFASMERYLGPLPLVTELRDEHQLLRGLVARLGEGSALAPDGQSARQQQPGGLPYLQTLDEFSKVLERHVRKEERQLFVEFEKRMPPDEALKLGKEIEVRLIKACPKL